MRSLTEKFKLLFFIFCIAGLPAEAEPQRGEGGGARTRTLNENFGDSYDTISPRPRNYLEKTL